MLPPVPVGASEDPGRSSEAEVRAILAHGPWPVPVVADPANRASGKAEAIEFGERLFFDTRLSGSGKFACATCHVPERNWTDNRTRGAATAEVDRNTPTLMNARLGRSFGWDGAADSLAAQSVRPFLDARELASSPRQVATLVRQDEQLACRYRASFGADPSATDDQGVLADVGRVLAAFVETLGQPEHAVRPIPRGARTRRTDQALDVFHGRAAWAEALHRQGNLQHLPQRAEFQRRQPARQRLLRAGRAGTSRSGVGREVQGRRRCATCCSPPPTATMASSRRSPMWCATTPSAAARKSSPSSSPQGEQSDLVVFLESVSTMANPWRPDDGWHCR